MGQRIILLVLATTLCFTSQLASALGLGEITLQSNLNQPLKAEIKLLQVRDLDKAEILVGLATPEDFDRIGVDRPYFLTDVRFDVDLDAVGGPVIKVSSRKQVREPFLNFIIQAQWPSGKLLREYTLLLDLPVYSDSQSAPVQGATTTQFARQPQQAAPQPVQQQAPASTGSASKYNPRSSFEPEGSFNTRRPSGSQASSAPPALAGTDEYSVRSGDTLWEISAQVRPDRGVSIQQTMLAIQKLNPDAFINNNINLLKKGQILRIPEREDITQTNQRSAVQEVAEQNREWSGDSYDYGSSNVQLEGSRSYASSDTGSTSREGRLKLSSPEDAADSYEGRGSGSGDSANKAALENELAITLEQLDKTSRENSDLRSKVASLEEQIETMERLVEVSSEDLRALELSAEKNAQEREAAADEESLTLEGEDSLDESELASDDTSGLDEEAMDEGVSDEATEEVATTEPEVVEEEKKPAPAPAPAVYEKTIVDHILDNIIYIGIGLLVLVVGGFIFMRSRADDGFDEDDFLQESAFDEPQSEFDVESALADEAENFDSFEEEVEEPEAEEESVSEAQTEDVVAEADIYIAYGKYDQAEDILVNALKTDPANKDARLKLVEVYASQQDGDKFDHHFAKLHELGDADIIGRAQQLRAGIEGIDVFDADTLVTDDDTGLDGDTTLTREPAAELDTDDSLDFSLDLDGEDDTQTREPSTDLDDAFDLDLGDEETGDDLDFDLGDLDSDSSEKTASDDSGSEEFSLDLEGDADDGGALDFDLGDDLDDDGLDADDFAIDLDSGETGAEELDLDLEGDDLALDDIEFDLGDEPETPAAEELIKDDLEEDIEPLEFDLGLDDTEVGSTPEVPADDLADLDLELEDTVSEASIPDELEDLEFDLGEIEDVSSDDSGEEFDLELSDDSVEDLTDVPDLSLDDVSDDALEPMLSGSEDRTLISPAITEEDLSDVDDLSLDGDLDLSALDQELDALTGSDSLDVSEPEPLPEPEPEPEPMPEVEEQLSIPEMDEPIVDFDALEETSDPIPPVEDVVEASPAPSADKAVSEMGEDTMFDQAMSEVPKSDVNFDLPEIDPESLDDDSDLGFLSDSDETATKLDLARAYIDMGDAEGAKDIITEIMKEGNEQQRQEAESLLQKLN